MNTLTYRIQTQPGSDYPILAGQNVIDIDPCDSPNEIVATIPAAAQAQFERHLNGCAEVVSYEQLLGNPAVIPSHWTRVRVRRLRDGRTQVELPVRRRH